MQIKMFSIKKATLIAFMMLGIASLNLMVSCSKEQAKPELSEQQKFEKHTVFKQPCTPEEEKAIREGFGCYIQNTNTGAQICGVYQCCTNCNRVYFWFINFVL